ncbi:MAG TPA: hypothetical protein VF391_08440 [Dermatophilaceae bacterium]
MKIDTMGFSEILARMTGRRSETKASPRLVLPKVPTSDDLLAACDRVEAMVAGGAVPAPVASRVGRVSRTVRDTIPRLSSLGAGSLQAYNVMATATDYLPEAVGGYLRLPRQFADSRPVDRGKTSLMILIDQLDLLAATMDKVFDAVCRADADALVAHGRFLAEKFGATAGGGALSLGPNVTIAPDPTTGSDPFQPPPGPDAQGRLQPPPGPGGP